METLQSLLDGFKVIFIAMYSLMEIPDIRQSVILSIITMIVGFIMYKMDASSEAIAKTCAAIELCVILSALFVI